MSKRLKLSKVIIYSVLGLLALITIYPFYTTIITSMTTQAAYMRNPLMLWPLDFNLDAYEYVFHNSNILTAFRNSLIVSVGGTFYSMILTVSAAYALSKTHVRGTRLMMYLVVITMFFSGGLIPTYLNIKNLGLYNSLWSLVLPGGISTFYMIIMKNAFMDIPKELEESAYIDGANDLVILFRVMLPLVKPTLACIVLFYAVDKWNEWYAAMLYIQDKLRQPLMYVLRTMVTKITGNPQAGLDAQMMEKAQTVYPVGIQKATILFTIVPIMLLYPFLQRYFLKGIMVGAVKG